LNSSDDENENSSSYDNSHGKNFDFYFSAAHQKQHAEHMSMPIFKVEKMAKQDLSAFTRDNSKDSQHYDD
jgi:hypothetical protein